MSLMHAPSRSAETRTPAALRGLPLESCHLAVDTKGGLARVRLVQRFTNPHREPLSVTYKLPLPADAAVSGFAFRLGDRRIVGVIEGRSEARSQYERAIVEGRSAALLEEDRSSLFTQEIGNIPPGAAVEAEIDIDQPLAWLPEGQFEWRFPLAAAPRYLGASDAAASLAREVGFATELSGTGARASLVMKVRDAIPGGRSPESPSHPLVTRSIGGSFEVELGGGNRAQLDRDVVVRWSVAGAAPELAIDVARPDDPASDSAYALVTLVPPGDSAGAAALPRDLTLLLDTSGSMSGEPLEQEKRVACALIDSLGEGDTLELIEFSNAPRAFKRAPEPVTAALKKEAMAWVRRLSASGGTEMVSGVKRALRELRPGSQRQIVLITDGLVGFEREIVETVLAGLPASARLHAMGVGSAVNRSLVAPIARAGRGIEALVGLGEDPERAAKRLIDRTVRPAVVDLVIEGSAVKRVAPTRLGDAYQGAPLRAAVELDPAGGTLIVRGRTADGAFRREIRVPATARGEGSASVTKLFARELVEDLEMRLSAGEHPADLDAEIERTGKRFAIATRLTSWIAQTEERTVDPRAGGRHVEQPHELPFGMSAEGLGLRAASASASVAPAAAAAAPEPAELDDLGVVGDFLYERAKEDAGRGGPLPGPGQAPRPRGRVLLGGHPGAPPPPVPARPSAPAPTGAPPPPAKAPAPASYDAPPGMAPPGMAPPPAGGFGGPPPKAESAAASGSARDEKKSSDLKARLGKAKKEAEPPQGKAIRAEKPLLARAWESVKNLVSGADAERSDEGAAGDLAASEEATAGTLRGRIVAGPDGRVRIEIVCPTGGITLDFAALVATLIGADGTITALAVQEDESTYAGSYAAGVTVRIALDLAEPAIGAGTIRLELGGLVVTASR